MALCKIHKFCEKFNLTYGYFNGKEILPNKNGVNTKKALEREKGLYLYNNHYCFI